MKLWRQCVAVSLAAGSIWLGGAIGEAAVWAKSDAPEIQYFGRWDSGNSGIRRTGRGAAYLRVDFTGTSLRVKLQEEKNWWRYSIDGREYTKFRPRTDEKQLAENLAPGRHTLFLARCSEGEAGISGFGGLLLDDGAQLLPPARASERRIEVIGDSISAGAMNDGPLGLSYYTIEDGLTAFGPVLAQKLGAEWSIVAKSGEGVVHNYTESWEKREQGKALHTEDTYPQTFFTQAKPQWNPAKFPPQCILLAIGTNDFVEQPKKPAAEAFIAGYERLLRLVRGMNPEAVLIAMDPIPINLGTEPGQWIQQAVAHQQQAGDRKLYFLPMHGPALQLKENDFIGDDTHPTIAGSRKIAAYLYGEVGRIMEWK